VGRGRTTKEKVQTYPYSIRRLGYGLGDRSSIPGRSNDGIFSSSPRRPDRLWGPSNLLSNEYRALLARG